MPNVVTVFILVQLDIECVDFVSHNRSGSTLTNALGHTFCDQVHLSIFDDTMRAAAV